MKQSKNPPVWWYYNPFSWFVLDRFETEKMLTKQIHDQQGQIFVTIGNKTIIDETISKKRHQQIGMHVTVEHHRSFSNAYNPVIFEDYLVTVKAPKKLVTQLEHWYKVTKIFNLETAKELHTIVSGKGRVIIKVERDAEKASKLRRKFAKNFLVPKEYRHLV